MLGFGSAIQALRSPAHKPERWAPQGTHIAEIQLRLTRQVTQTSVIVVFQEWHRRPTVVQHRFLGSVACLLRIEHAITVQALEAAPAASRERPAGVLSVADTGASPFGACPGSP